MLDKFPKENSWKSMPFSTHKKPPFYVKNIVFKSEHLTAFHHLWYFLHGRATCNHLFILVNTPFYLVVRYIDYQKKLPVYDQIVGWMKDKWWKINRRQLGQDNRTRLDTRFEWLDQSQVRIEIRIMFYLDAGFLEIGDVRERRQVELVRGRQIEPWCWVNEWIADETCLSGAASLIEQMIKRLLPGSLACTGILYKSFKWKSRLVFESVDFLNLPCR